MTSPDRNQVQELQQRIDRLLQGYEGCCTACEPVGVLNQKLEQRVQELVAALDEALADRDYFYEMLAASNRERDEARREVLLWLGERSSAGEMRQEVRKRGWEYLQEDSG